MNVDGPTYPDRGNGDLTAPVRNSRSCFDDMGNVDPTVTDRGRGVFTDRFVNDRDAMALRYEPLPLGGLEPKLADPLQSRPAWEPACISTRTTNPVPEAAGAVADLQYLHQPIWVIDVHNQGPSRGR